MENARIVTRSFSPEIWVADREAFIFRFRDWRFGDLASFCVPEATLKELRPAYPFVPAVAFDGLRSLIYEAAVERMKTGGSMVQHVVTAHELRVLRNTRLPVRLQGNLPREGRL